MKKLRTQIGLTQTDMAKLIGCNKTTSSLHEKGLRDLNPQALATLSIIEVFLEHPARIQPTEKISLNEQKAIVAMLNKLSYNQKRAAQKYEITQQKLLLMEEAYASNRKLWLLLKELKINSKRITPNPYVDVLEIRCLEKSKRCGLPQQMLLRHQMTILNAEITSAQEIIDEYMYFAMPENMVEQTR
ncbi:helix-turn-helix transcriptional regulator [Pedobacter aquatilis]|uniref:helix-turn-helix transcriptional regulator n=1 Tax=Pedobacter aquatilis TaxID=351343 RepID=UPI00292D2368|nr:helix-turn-helix transcriptional regulator [Pedobacter aquatilis]